MKKSVVYVQLLAMVVLTMSGFFYGLPAVQAIGGPILTVVTPVPTHTSSTAPSFTFNSDTAASNTSVALGGSCGNWSGYIGGAGVLSGDNTIVFDVPGLGEGTYSDCFIDVSNGVATTTLNIPEFTVDISYPSLNSGLGDGSSDYSLPSTCPSAACDRGDIYGAALIFNEELDSASKTAVEDAITDGADVAPRTYVWATDRVRIYATEPVTFADDVFVDISDLAGNVSTDVKLIDSRDINQPIIYVDDDYYDGGENDSHVWDVDAFNNIQDGIDAVTVGGTVNILAGNYDSDSSITVENDGLQIIGPGIDVPGQAIFQNTSCNRVFDVRASGVRIEGLVISQRDGLDGSYCYNYPVIKIGDSSFGAANTVIEGNDIAGGQIGVAVNYQSTDTTVQNNNIHNNSAYGVVIWENINTIQDNEISYNGWGIGMACGGDGCYDGYNLSGTEVSGNSIYYNFDGGIRYYAGDQESPVSIGPDNIITGNPEGIYVYGGSYNLFINGNQIYDNSLPTSGLHVEDDSTGLDATGNWWGDPSGPYEETGNPGGIGNPVTIINSSYIYYRPFCTDGDCDYLSSVEVTPDNLGALFENGGSITPMLDDDVATSTASVTSLSVNEETSIAVPSGSGTSTVTLPASTIITKTDGGTFDANDITAADVALSGISGLAAGKVVEGAFQWGIPSLGLTFSPAITINVFVGEDLDGQTLTIYRSNSQTSGWETSGIVAPGTCTISEGICSFQTTKASYFATAKSVSIGGGGTLLSYQTALNAQNTTTPTYAYPVNPDHNFIKVKDSPAIYWLSSANKRYLFANREVFSSWFGDDFSGLKEISQSEFDNITLGGNLTVKPGSYLRFENQATIYRVDENNNIYPATTTPGRVYTIQASFENNYRLKGQIRRGLDLISAIINNRFIQITGQPAVYWLSPENVRYLFTNRGVFSSWFINNFAGLRQISQAEFDQLESGGNLTVKPGSYLKFDNSDILYRVVNSNNICKATSSNINFYQVQAGFEADYNITGDCQ